MGRNYSPGRPGMGRADMGGAGRPGMEQSPQFGGMSPYSNRMHGGSPQTQRGQMGGVGSPGRMDGLGGSPQRPGMGGYGAQGANRFGRGGMPYGGRQGLNPRMEGQGMSPRGSGYGAQGAEGGRITGGLQGRGNYDGGMSPRGNMDSRLGGPAGAYGLGGQMPRDRMAGLGRNPVGGMRDQGAMGPATGRDLGHGQRGPSFRPQGLGEQERGMMGQSPQECPLKRQGLLRSNELFPDVGVNGSQLSDTGSMRGTPLGGRFQGGNFDNQQQQQQMGHGPYSEYQDIPSRATSFGLDRPWLNNTQQRQPPAGLGGADQYDPSRSPGRHGQPIRSFMGQSGVHEQGANQDNGRYHALNVHDSMNRSMVGEQGEHLQRGQGQPQREMFQNGRQFNTAQDYKGIRAGIPDSEFNNNQTARNISPITIRGERAGAGALGERNPNIHPYGQEANNMTQIPQGGVTSPYNKTYVNKGPGNYEEVGAQSQRFGMNPTQKLMQQRQGMFNPGQQQGNFNENGENAHPMMNPNQRFTPIGGPNYRGRFGRSIEDTNNPAGGILGGRINQQTGNYRHLTGRANDEIIHQPPTIDSLYVNEPPSIDDLYATQLKTPQTPIRKEHKQAPHLVIQRENAVYADEPVGYSYPQNAQQNSQPAQEKPNKKLGERDFNSMSAFDNDKGGLRLYQRQQGAPSFMQRILTEDYINGRGSQGFMEYVNDFRDDLMLALQVRDELIDREFKSCPLMLPKYNQCKYPSANFFRQETALNRHR